MGRKEETTKSGLRVAVTGASGDLGSLLLPLLEQDDRVESILALDVVKAPPSGARTTWRRLDLARHDADRELTELLREHRIDALYHLAFLFSPIQNGALAHELEVIGSLHVLTAAAAVGLKRLVVPSLTAVYGARSGHPSLLDEDTPTDGAPASRFVQDKIEVERQVNAFRPRHADTRVIVLRFAPILGPSVDNPVTRLLKARIVPSLMGFDPLWQAVHEEDAARALHLALHSEAEGTFNVVGRGVLPLSGMVKLAGGNVLPLPAPLARGTLVTLNAAGALGVPLPLLDYIQYSWVADGARAERALGFSPRYHAREAVGAVNRRA
jgi:UDP-glucose 4-epimerase